MDREINGEDLWQAFNPVSLMVGAAFAAVGRAAVLAHTYDPISDATDESEDDESDEDEVAA